MKWLAECSPAALREALKAVAPELSRCPVTAPVPDPAALRTKGRRLALRAVIRNLNPGYFAVVMATGIAVAGDEPGRRWPPVWIPAQCPDRGLRAAGGVMRVAVRRLPEGVPCGRG